MSDLFGTPVVFKAFVPGDPIAQGSMQARCINLNPLYALVRGKRFADILKWRPMLAVYSDNAKLKSWRKSMDKVFALTAKASGICEPLNAPLQTTLVFVMPMLKGHVDGKDKRFWAETDYDADKLERAVNDSLTSGKVIINDSRICDTRRKKRYAQPGESPGVHVTIRILTQEER